ncbi:MAG: metallophosphoesterase [Gemmatimonadales bacterium]|nr:metallophosphoesterase [Gemmatimonadales bacterium]
MSGAKERLVGLTVQREALKPPIVPPHTGLTRRQFLVGSGIGLAAGALALEGIVLEPRRLEISSHTLGTPLPGRDPLRLAVITDLHLQEVSELHHALAAAVHDANPDAILLVGDSIDHLDSFSLLSDFLQLLPPAGIRVATLGNWEYWSKVDLNALRRTYERGNTQLLVNEGLAIAPGAVLYGTDDWLAGNPTLEPLSNYHGDDVVVLSHSPAFRDTLTVPHPNIRAILSGHTHGGQIAIGGWAPFRPPGSGRYVSGWYRGDGPDLFVSRGLGTSVIPVRLGSVPELALIDWHPGLG